MEGETPFANLSLPSFEDGPADSPQDVLNLASLGSAELSRGSLARRSLDEASPGKASHAQAGLLRSHTVANPFDVAEMLTHINCCKLAGRQQQQLVRAGSAGSGGPTTITDGASLNLKWIQPSGARQPGQGCEDIEQGIVHAEQTSSGGAVVRITLLAAGFIIGPSGSSVRDICRQCGTDVKSWTCEPDTICPRPTRQFRVEGPPGAVARALEVMCDAVQRYKELCEGKYAGQAVPRIQHVAGIDFSYQPPPRNIVPFAASLKSQGSAKRQGSGGLAHKGSGGPHHGRPPTGPSYNDAISRSTSASLAPASGAAAGASPQQHPVPLPLARSSSLPPPSRSSPSPAPRGAPSPSPGGSSKGARPQRERSPAKREGPRVEGEPQKAGSPPRGLERALPSPFGEASEQEQTARGSPKGEVGKEKEKQAEGREAPQATTPAPARTLGKEDVLRTVFAGVGQAQTAVPAPDFAAAPASTFPPWVQQLALQQQHQQQLAATAAAAQAMFPTQGSLLTELAGLMQSPAGLGALDPATVFGRAPAPQQGQLQAALAALGLGAGGAGALVGRGDMGQPAFLGAAPALAGNGGGGNWAPNAAALGGMQASFLNGSPLHNQGDFLQLAASGLLPQPLAGPGTPNPTPLPATTFPSPDCVPDHHHLLAALQALSECPSQRFGAVGSPELCLSPGASGGTSRTSLEMTPSPVHAVPSTASPTSAGLSSAAELSLGSAFGVPMSTPLSVGPTGGPSQLSAFAAPYTTLGGLGMLGQAHCLTDQGGDSPFGAVFAAPTQPASASAFSLSRASSVAFVEGQTQPAVMGAGRSFSMPLHQPGSQHADPWADLIASAVEECGEFVQVITSPGRGGDTAMQQSNL